MKNTEIKNISFNIRTSNDNDLRLLIDNHVSFNLLTRIYAKFIYECFYKSININNIVSGLSDAQKQQAQDALYNLILIIKDAPDTQFRGYFGFFCDPNFSGLSCANFNIQAFDNAVQKLQSDPNSISEKSVVDALYPNGWAGPKPKWVLADKNSPSRWSINSTIDPIEINKGISKLIDDRTKIAKSNPDDPLVILNGLGFKGKLLPIIQSISEGFERAAFAKAIAKLRTYITNSNKRKEERIKQKDLLKSIEDKYKNNSGWALLKQYEIDRSLELNSTFKINFSQLKGWKEIRNLWLKSKKDLLLILNEYQKNNPQQFGDSYLFDWLIGNSDVWEKEDLLTEIAKYNDEAQPLKGITFTSPDPIKHPEWLFFAEDGNSNQSKCGNLIPTKNSEFDCLLASNNSKSIQKISLSLSKSNRLVSVKEHSVSKLKLKSFDKNGKCEIDCEIGGVHIEIDREILSSIKYDLNQLQNLDINNLFSKKDVIVNLITDKLNSIKRNYHNLKLSCACEIPIENIKYSDLGLSLNKETNIYFFNPKKDKQLERFIDQTALSIDLGQKDAIAYAITKLKLKNEADLNINNLYGLEIINTGIKGPKNRDYSSIINKIQFCKSCCHLQNAIVSNIKQLTKIPKNIDDYLEKSKTLASKIGYFWSENTDETDLHSLFNEVNSLAKKAHDEIVNYFNDKNNRHYFDEFVDFKYLDLLERRINVEKVFVSRQQINTTTKQFFSKRSFDFHHMNILQEHFNNVKLDRCKKIARSIVNLALKNNIKVIVLEKLETDFSQSNTKSINKNLHKWSVKTIIGFVNQFAKMHAICVGDVHPAYTSQYAAKNGEKGSRYYSTNNVLKKSAFGDILITKSGSEYNANINAALNIALKFFGKKIEAISDDDEKEKINDAIDILVERRYNKAQIA